MLAITGRCGEDPEKDSVRVGMSQMTGPEQKKSEVKVSRSPRHKSSLCIGVYSLLVLSSCSGRLCQTQITSGCFLQNYRNYLMSSSALHSQTSQEVFLEAKRGSALCRSHLCVSQDALAIRRNLKSPSGMNIQHLAKQPCPQPRGEEGRAPTSSVAQRAPPICPSQGSKCT